MRHLLTLACLAFVTGAVAEEADFDFKSLGARKAMRDYKAALAKEDKAKQKAMKEMEAEAKKAQKKYRIELIMNLEQALKKVLQDADLEEANKINAAIKALKKRASPAGAPAVGSKGKKGRARIPRNAVAWQGHHYMLFHIRGSHSQAQKNCQAMGGHLARIQNAEEHNLISKMVRSRAMKSQGWLAYWVDGTDKEKEGLWKFSDGSRINYFSWNPGSPSNSRIDNNIIFHRHELTFTDKFAGDAEKGFICEWDE